MFYYFYGEKNQQVLNEETIGWRYIAVDATTGKFFAARKYYVDPPPSMDRPLCTSTRGPFRGAISEKSIIFLETPGGRISRDEILCLMHHKQFNPAQMANVDNAHCACYGKRLEIGSFEDRLTEADQNFFRILFRIRLREPTV